MAKKGIYYFRVDPKGSVNHMFLPLHDMWADTDIGEGRYSYNWGYYVSSFGNDKSHWIGKEKDPRNGMLYFNHREERLIPKRIKAYFMLLMQE